MQPIRCCVVLFSGDAGCPRAPEGPANGWKDHATSGYISSGIMSRVVKLEYEEIDEFPYVPKICSQWRKTRPARTPIPRANAIDGITAEAIRIYRCLMGGSWSETAREFGCTRNAVIDIVHGKYHNGKKRGDKK